MQNEIIRSIIIYFFSSPRRFGKSLWLSIMESYYDVAFEELFGKYYIGQHPTLERNKYLILSFNFAGVSPDIDRLEQSFRGHLDLRLMAFNLKYAHLFPADYMEGYRQCVNAEQRFGYVMLRCQFAKLSVYLIIDEYDNFMNVVLYFVNSLITSGSTPDSLVDPNVRTDYAKLRYLIILDKKLNGNFSRIKQIAEDGEIVSDILLGFPAEELMKPANFVSLLFYFGILTIDREEEGMVVLKVPNLTIRQMLFSYLERGYLEAGVFEVKMMELSEMMRYMAYRGEWCPVFEYFGKELRNQTSIRDYIEGEKALQTLHLVYMGLTNHFTIWPEQELGKGYCDLWMAPNLVNHPGMKYSYVVEFKYLKYGATEQEVANKLEEAKGQLRRYAGDERIKAQAGGTEMRYIAVVYRTWELVALEETGMPSHNL